jgi:hypothetical protein
MDHVSLFMYCFSWRLRCLCFRVLAVTVSYNEMGIAINAWGYDISVKQLHKMLLIADVDNSGQITEPAFEQIVLQILKMKLGLLGIMDKELDSADGESSKVDGSGHSQQVGGEQPGLASLPTAEMRSLSKRLLEVGSDDFHDLRNNLHGAAQATVTNGVASLPAKEDFNSKFANGESSNGQRKAGVPPLPPSAGTANGAAMAHHNAAPHFQLHTHNQLQLHDDHAVAPFEYLTVDSCTHEELVRYTNRLIGANIKLSNAIHVLNELMTRGPV